MTAIIKQKSKHLLEVVYAYIQAPQGAFRANGQRGVACMRTTASDWPLLLLATTGVALHLHGFIGVKVNHFLQAEIYKGAYKAAKKPAVSTQFSRCLDSTY